MTDDHVVLVNARDEAVGTAPKLEAHRSPQLHRAFSIFVFDADGRLLLQQRHPDKYHSGGLWSNTCCSHPRPGERLDDAVHRRLDEEMGFQCALDRAFGFVYQAQVGPAVYEHEYDHVFVGTATPAVQPNAEEVADWQWITPEALLADVDARPAAYTVWFRTILEQTLQHYATSRRMAA
ncbi:isopentenyl-diphosphate Delta-isomerase [Salisaeta longa]|uniref:isopentenyl-diphosphate Delta-isomerase n=1 Tax=Salisaeta longa TaxID=503170 RepID=UPI0003B4001B|nr:isopentenyl-diphosphate Delta-isomerase [Salisaeta longa]